MISTTSSTVRTLASFTAIASLAFAAGCGPEATSGGDAKSPTTVSDAHDLAGKPAPEITAEYVTGDGPKTIKEASGKVLILDFWGTFCEPCKKSFPKYQDVVDAHAGKVAVLAVSIDEPENTQKEKLVEFAKEHKAKFAIAWDKDHKAAEAYALSSLTMPSSFVIDKTGTIKKVNAGFKEEELPELDKLLKELE